MNNGNSSGLGAFLLVFAFKEWPTTRELNYLRARAGGYGPPPGQYPPGQYPPGPPNW